MIAYVNDVYWWDMNYTITDQSTPHGVLYVRWGEETHAEALHPRTALDVDKQLRRHLKRRLDGRSVSTEIYYGHLNWAGIFTSDHLGTSPDATEEELIAACEASGVAWESVGFFVDTE